MAVGRRQRIELEGVFPDRQFLVVGVTGDGAVDVGELAAARLVPGPYLGRNIIGHLLVPFCSRDLS